MNHPSNKKSATFNMKRIFIMQMTCIIHKICYYSLQNKCSTSQPTSVKPMCSSNHSLPILRPIQHQHQNFLEEIFPQIPGTFINRFIEIACYGMHTEIITAISLLTPIQHLMSGRVNTGDDWRSGGSEVLFSALPKAGGAKLQTLNMQLLHDHVIPWLATENAILHREQLKVSGITAIFMHSCGDERFPTPLWENEPERRAQMLAEQQLRTETDWRHGVRLVDDKTVLQKGLISPNQLAIVNWIMEQSNNAPHLCMCRGKCSHKKALA